MEGKQFSSSQRRRHLRARRARALPARRAPLLHLRGRPGEPGRRLHLGGVRPAHQRRARRRLGQPGQPHGDDDRQELRRDPGGRRADRRRRGAARRTSSAAFDDRRRPDRPAPAEGGASPRRCGSSARSTSTSPTPSRASSRATTSASGSARSCTSPRRRSPTSTRCSSPFLPHSRQRGRPRCSAARATSRRCRAIEEVDDLDGGPAYPVITGDYSGTPRLGAPRRRARHAGREADAGLHQARPVGRRRGARPAGGSGRTA